MQEKPTLIRVSMTLDAVDVDLLDRLARLEGKNRSYELRGMLRDARPVVKQTVEALEAASRQRDEFERVASTGLLSELGVLMPEIERLSSAYTGALSRMEGALAAAESDEIEPTDPRASNTGVTPPTPTTPDDE